MIRPTRGALALAVALGLPPLAAQDPTPAPKPPPAQEPAQPAKEPDPWVQFTTPDGSTFLLVATTDLPVIHWATITPAGDLVDPSEHPGLSFAVARAALSGTDTTGTRNWNEERKLLGTIDRLTRQSIEAKIHGEADADKLIAEAVRAKRELAAVRDPGAWLRELRSAPSVDFELTELPDAVLLTLTTTDDGIAAVARLLMDRRENAVLRTLEIDYPAVIGERATEQAAPSARLRAEMRDLAFSGLVVRGDTFQVVDPEVARDLFRRTHSPAAAFHVLAGGFDLAAMRTFLERQFSVTGLPRQPWPAPTRRRTSHERVSTIAGPRPAVAYGFELGEATDPLAASILAETFAGGDDSFLALHLRARGFLGIEVRMEAPFPASARPGLLFVELVPTENAPSADDLARALGEIASAAPHMAWSSLEGGMRRMHSRGWVVRSDPAKLARWLAIECGVRRRSAAEALDRADPALDYTKYVTLAKQVLVDAPRTIVRMEPGP